MSEDNLQILTVDQLVGRFATIGVEQDEAEKAEDNAKYRRLFYQMSEVQKELKTRPGDQRRALVKLFDYPNMQVRLMAAQYALGVVPQDARRTIEAIAASTWAPQCYDARMCLGMLDEGKFIPE
jgi:hypothetical protein